MLQQAQLPGACYRFGAALNVEFVKDSAVVSFDRIQGEEKARANLSVREPLGDQFEYFQLAWAQWLNQGLGR